MTYVTMWVVSFLFSISKKDCFLKSLLFFYVVMLFYVIIVTREAGVDRDYAQYLGYMLSITNGDDIGSTRGGGLFDAVSYFMGSVGFPCMVFGFYAVAIFIKANFFFKLPEIAYCSFLIYAGYFLFLHEFTQIRVGLGLGVAYFALYYKFNDKPFFQWAGCMALSCFIHPSLLIIPAFLFVYRYLTKAVLSLVLLVSIFLCFFDLSSAAMESLVRFLDISDLNLYFQLAADMQEDKVNYFGLFPLLNLSLSVCALIFLQENKCSQFVTCLVKMFVCSEIVWFAFYPIPGLAARLSQILLFSVVIVLPYLSLVMLGNKRVLSIGYSFIGFIAYIYFGGLMGEYFSSVEAFL